MGLEARKCPPDLSQDRGIARRCKLFLGTELGRGALVQEAPFVWPPMERRREFAAANLQAESYLEREHNARWAALAVAHANSLALPLVDGYPGERRLVDFIDLRDLANVK